MKIKGIPGEYFAQALKKPELRLCGCFHRDKESAVFDHGVQVEWPVEIMDGIAYVPSEEELKDDN